MFFGQISLLAQDEARLLRFPDIYDNQIVFTYAGDLYTVSADGKTINAFIMNWPGKQLIIKQIKPKDGSKIRMIGSDPDLNWKYNEKNGLTIDLIDQAKLPCKYVWVLKIEGEEI